MLTSVLLVEDDPAFRGLVTRFIESHRSLGLVVVGAARTAEEGLALARELDPDAVVLDLILPGMTGIELVPRLREALPRVAIVILTPHDEEASRRAALDAGADGFVPKAKMSTDLLSALLRAVEARRNPQGD